MLCLDQKSGFTLIGVHHSLHESLLIMSRLWYSGMIIYPSFTPEFLSTLGLKGKFGGSFMETTVNSYYLMIIYCSYSFHTISELVWFLFSTVGEVVEVGDFSPKYAAFWIESGW